MQEQGQDGLGILAERVGSSGNTPVVHKPALKHGIGFRNIVYGKCFLENSLLFALGDNLTKKLVIGAAGVHHVFFAAGDQLSCKKLAEQLYGYGVVDHQEQFSVHVDQFIKYG